MPLVLEVSGSIPAGGEENLVSGHASLGVICRDVMNTVCRPSDRDVTWRPHVQGQSSPVQVNDPYTGSIFNHACRLIPQIHQVYNVHLPRIIRN